LKLPIEGVREKDRAIRARVDQKQSKPGAADLPAGNAAAELRVCLFLYSRSARFELPRNAEKPPLVGNRNTAQ